MTDPTSPADDRPAADYDPDVYYGAADDDGEGGDDDVGDPAGGLQGRLGQVEAQLRLQAHGTDSQHAILLDMIDRLTRRIDELDPDDDSPEPEAEHEPCFSPHTDRHGTEPTTRDLLQAAVIRARRMA